MSPAEPLNAFERLYHARKALATRPFLARGSTVSRCVSCLMDSRVCICPYKVATSCAMDWVLIMHTDEVFKPTNTGRLLADVFPSHTHAYVWDRTTPDAALLQLINDPKRQCALLFPNDADRPRDILSSPAVVDDDKKLTVMVLDGTWKQAKKMFRSSRWLASLPVLGLGDEMPVTSYGVRKAIREGQLSTAEAAVWALEAFGEPRASRHLHDYFQVFNAHYRAARLNRTPILSESHQRIKSLKTAPRS